MADDKKQANQQAQAPAADDLKENEGYRYEPGVDENGNRTAKLVKFKVDPETGLEAS
jgi:hypothetical protein